MHGADSMITYSGDDGFCFIYAIHMKLFPDKTEMSYIMGDVRLDISIYPCIHLFIQQMFMTTYWLSSRILCPEEIAVNKSENPCLLCLCV